jgi:MoaA/NifB/PqqE/SkfB family radical SAM enzyme
MWGVGHENPLRLKAVFSGLNECPINKKMLKELTRPFKAILSARFLGRPFILSHLITRRCNADCPFCLWKAVAPQAKAVPASGGPGVPEEELDTPGVKGLYAQAGKLGFLSVVVWGGEPLLREDFPEVLQSARQSGLKTTIITNGYYLPERLGDIGPYLDTLLVSIDAPGELHDSLRRLPGTFRRATEGIRAIRARFPEVRCIIISVITGQNLQEVGGLLEFSHKERLPIIFQAINLRDYGPSPRPIESQAVPPREGQSMAFRLIRQAKARGFPVVNSYEYLNACINTNGHYRCHYKKLVLRVDANGDVMDCTRPGRVMANVRQKTLQEIIESPGYQDFIKRAESCNLCVDAGTLEASYLWELHPRPLFEALRFLSSRGTAVGSGPATRAPTGLKRAGV